MPALRGHHLVCLHFFNGEGYNNEFIENLSKVLTTAEYHKIDVLHGADDVCSKCPNLKQEKCNYTESADVEIREMDKKALHLLGLSGGASIGWKDIRKRIPGIFQMWYREYCNSCGWKRACEQNDLYRNLSDPVSIPESGRS